MKGSVASVSLPDLAGRPLFEARQPDALEAELRRNYRIRSVRFGPADRPFLGLANRVQVEGVSLHYCRYDMPTDIGFADMGGYRQIFCLTGAGEISVTGRRLLLDPRSTGVIPPTSQMDVAYGDSYQHLVVQFDETLLQRKAELMTGRAPAGLGDLPIMTAMKLSAANRTRSVAFSLAQQFAEPGSQGLAATELASALATCFLEEQFSGLHPAADTAGPAARAVAVRLRDYIHANWDQPLTVESIAAAMGMSTRSVFNAFRQSFGVAPAAYIRDLRLDHAREILAEPAAASVIEVAMACGFASLGHFARRYRDRFGELPSETLARRL